jgi:hypothetical protein
MKTTTRSKRSQKPPVAVVSINNDLPTNISCSRSRSRSERVVKCSEQKLPSSRRRQARERNLLMDITAGFLASFTRGALIFMSAIMVYSVVDRFRNEDGLMDYIKRSKISNFNSEKLHIPSGLDQVHRRSLSLNLGGGDCLWQVSSHQLIISCLTTIVSQLLHILYRLSLLLKMSQPLSTFIKLPWLVFLRVINA